MRFHSLFPYMSQGRSLLIGLASAFLTATPSIAAEKIYFTVGPVSLNLKVESLKTFAETGTVPPDLAFYLRPASPELREQIRTILNQSRPLNPVSASFIFYDPMGETMLRYVGQILQTEAGQNGVFALRAALIKAASRPEGLSLIGMLEEFPTQGIRFDLNLLIRKADQVRTFVRETDAVIAAIRQTAEENAALDPEPDLETAASLRDSGTVPYEMKTLTLRDEATDRTFPVDVYLPELPAAEAGSIPVVVISHGLSSGRDNFAAIARHLASHGLAAAVPEHVNSNFDRKQALLNGRAFELFKVSEFIDRPKDISHTLDALEQMNETTLQQRLNLDAVGVLGHSFGGYTALITAGATVDFEQLDDVCNLSAINVSLLLQCRALELRSDPEAVRQLSEEGLRDDRVAAVIALNPVSSILGDRGVGQIQVPVLIGASGYDPATPIVPEQTQTFTWLKTQDKYLVLAEGASHTPELTALVNSLFFSSVSTDEITDEQRLLQGNVKGLILSFFQVYIGKQESYLPYLQASFIRGISEPPFVLSGIRTFTLDQLESALTRAAERVTPTDQTTQE